MSTFSNFAFRREYEHIAELGDRLGEVEKLVKWESFRPIIGEIYANKEGKGGRPNFDEILMIKKRRDSNNGMGYLIRNLNGR